MAQYIIGGNRQGVQFSDSGNAVVITQASSIGETGLTMQQLLGKAAAASWGKAQATVSLVLKARTKTQSSGRNFFSTLPAALAARALATARAKLGPTLELGLLGRAAGDSSGRARGVLTLHLAASSSSNSQARGFFGGLVAGLRARGFASSRGQVASQQLLVLKGKSRAGSSGRATTAERLLLHGRSLAAGAGKLTARAFGPAVYSFTAFFWRRPK